MFVSGPNVERGIRAVPSIGLLAIIASLLVLSGSWPHESDIGQQNLGGLAKNDLPEASALQPEPESTRRQKTNLAGPPACDSIPVNRSYDPACQTSETAVAKAWLEELSYIAFSTDGADVNRTEELLDNLMQSGFSGLLAIKELLLKADFSASKSAPGSPDQAYRKLLLSLLLNAEVFGVDKLAMEVLLSQPGEWEVAQIGLFLLKNFPGQYRDTIGLAAQHALLEADPSRTIPGELFQLLGETGDSSILGLLTSMPMNCDAYTSVALALFEDGSGIPMLTQDARLFETGQATAHGRLAISLLAQVAYRSQEAQEVLIELAQKNLVPVDLWPQVVDLLIGRTMISLLPTTSAQAPWNTIFQQEGNQLIYLVSNSTETGSIVSLDQRLYLLGQLSKLAPAAFSREFTAARNRLVQIRPAFGVVPLCNRSNQALAGIQNVPLLCTVRNTS